jgi:hypothetical protein
VKRIFFDTEFTGLVVDPKLISIGLIDETGARTFYAELTDTWQMKDVRDDFVHEVVLPHLEGGTARMTMTELGERLTIWLEDFNEPVQLATDALFWDWPWIREIFHAHGKWPANVDGKPLLLTMNYLNDFDAFEAGMESAFSAGLRRHHALDDANANRLGWIAAGGDIDRATEFQREEL